MVIPKVVDKREPYHPLAYVFIYFAFFVGGTFLFMGITHDGKGITMYQVMNNALGYPGNIIWASLLIASGCGTLFFYFHRKPWVATISASLGALIWLFLGWLYISQGYFDGIMAAVIPNLWFWTWYWFKAGRYKRTERDARGIIDNPARVTSLWPRNTDKRFRLFRRNR